MKHLNGNKLCAVTLRTTGPYPRHHDLVQLTVIVINQHYEIDTRYMPFNISISPDRLENIDYSEIKEYKIEDNNLDYRQFSMPRSDLMNYISKGRESSYAADLFVQWFENLKLPFRKKIVPLAYDWAFAEQFIEDWLGRKTLDLCFDQRHRDLRSISLFLNDRADYRCDISYPFAKNNFRYICSQLKVEVIKNGCIADGVSMIECYKRLCKSFF